MRSLVKALGLNSIQGRLTAISLLFIIGTAVTIGVVTFRVTVAFENDRFRDHFRLLVTNLASNAELGVLLGNEKILEGLAENMLAVNDVRIVEILDKNGNILIRRAADAEGFELDNVSAPVMSRAMSAEEMPFFEAGVTEEKMGQARVFFSRTGLDQLKKQLALRFVLISVLLASVPVVMYWALSRAISAPLKNLLNLATQVSSGNMDIRADGGSLAETRTLAGAINDMLDALQAQRQQLNAANAEMARQQVLAEVGKFSMTVAHEIKNPLAIMKGSLGVLKKERSTDPAVKQRMLGFLDDEVNRINQLIEDFLLFARPRPPAFRAVRLRDLIGNIRQRVRLMDADVQIEEDLPPGSLDLEVRCDQALLERALLNVIRNALEACAGQAAVRLALSLDGNDLRLAVIDGGPGIRTEILQEIFEPFFSTKSKGTGLGLAIAREVVSAHGGTLTAANGEEGGARFVFHLKADAGAP